VGEDPQAIALDSNWLRANPLPQPDADTDKNGRGRVLAIGGCALVPGGIQLTAEAALRAGAGKVQVGTIERAALPIGIAMPEVAVIAMPETASGEIAAPTALLHQRMSSCDAIIAGPAMSCATSAGRIVDQLLGTSDCRATLVLDAAALMELAPRAALLRARAQPAILTPHLGEMASLLETGADAVEADRTLAASRAASRFGAIVVLKGPTTVVAAPTGSSHDACRIFAYAGGGVGLATGGSGDVLAGIAAGLAARGADPLRAALWAVWLHGEAGRRCAEQFGPLGFLARELLTHMPPLMRAV
jgi:hydroxyethylthiazole kinase-like uncharacterized protein yjeF